MSETPPRQPSHPIQDFFRGLGNVADFLWESTLALIELATGRWLQPPRKARQGGNAPNEGVGPVEKILPFPIDE